jgi:hypothetical protein
MTHRETADRLEGIIPGHDTNNSEELSTSKTENKYNTSKLDTTPHKMINLPNRRPVLEGSYANIL